MGWTFDGPVFDEDGFRSKGCAERSPGGAKDQTSRTLTGHTDRVSSLTIAGIMIASYETLRSVTQRVFNLHATEDLVTKWL